MYKKIMSRPIKVSLYCYLSTAIYRPAERATFDTNTLDQVADRINELNKDKERLPCKKGTQYILTFKTFIFSNAAVFFSMSK